MKTTSYLRRTSFIALNLLLFSSGLYAQRTERHITREFNYTSATRLSIESKFGNVNILNSDKEMVSVDATIWVTGGNQKLSDDLSGDLDAEITESDGTITVKSIFPDKLPSRNNTQFGIDFTIHVPESITLNLENKYGAVYIDNLSGPVNIDVSYGNLKIQSLNHGKENPLNEINLAYSTGSITSAEWLKLNLAYSKLTIGQATAVVALSKYSGLILDECSSLVVESKYDTYRTGELKNYVGDLKYSNLSAARITGKFEITSSYSVIKVEEIGDHFETVKIDNTRGSYKIGVSSGSSFTIEAEAKRGDISVNGVDDLNKRIENADKYISGKYGSNPTGKINVSSTEGSVQINVH